MNAMMLTDQIRFALDEPKYIPRYQKYFNQARGICQVIFKVKSVQANDLAVYFRSLQLHFAP